MTMEIVGKNVVFFSYWTYMTMEIFSIDVGFFQLLDLYDYGNSQKKMDFLHAI